MVRLFSSVLACCVIEIYSLSGGMYWLSVLYSEDENGMFLLNIYQILRRHLMRQIYVVATVGIRGH